VLCPSVTRVHPAKTAEWIEVLFGRETFGDPRNIGLDGVLISHREGEGRGGDSMLPSPNYFGDSLVKL